MRRLGPAAVLLGLLAAGCGGDGDGAVWEGRPQARADGTVPVAGFAAFQQEVEQRWERAPALVAGEFLRLDEEAASRTTIAVDAGPEASGPARVTVTLEGLLDDSVAAERYVLRLRRDGETWTLDAARWSQRCRPGRGHQEFAPGACL